MLSSGSQLLFFQVNSCDFVILSIMEWLFHTVSGAWRLLGWSSSARTAPSPRLNLVSPEPEAIPEGRASRVQIRASRVGEGPESFTSRRLVGDGGLQQLSCFCPALALWELIEMQDSFQTAQATAWTFDAALLFVDISGFTNLSTKLTVDCLQDCIALTQADGGL